MARHPRTKKVISSLKFAVSINVVGVNLSSIATARAKTERVILVTILSVICG